MPPVHPGAPGRDDIHGIRYQDLERVGWDHVPWLVVVICTFGDGVNTQLFEALHTTIDTEGAYDIYDMQQIRQSWTNAEVRRSDAIRQERAAGG